MASSMGMHLLHLLDDGGGRHVGEVLVPIVLTLALFAGSWYGAWQAHKVVKDGGGIG